MADVGGTQSEVTIGLPNYELIADLYGDAEFDVASQYARASALDDFGCSGFLISDDVYVNARHCRVMKGGAVTIDVHWGRYGTTDADFSLATKEARNRTQNLGVPMSQLPNVDAALKTWKCDLALSPSKRDIDYWRCRPNSLAWTEQGDGARNVTLNLLPGHVWGYYKSDSGSRPVGTALYTSHMVRRCTDSTRNLVISTQGGVKDTDYGCVSFANEDPEHCFEHGLDIIPGSSGAPVVDKSTHQAYGVMHGHWTYWLGTADKVCEGWPSGQVANLATRFGPEVFTMTQPEPVFQSPPFAGWGSNWIGGTGGTADFSACPTGYLAAGVVGTASSSGYLGNFGFVCMPSVGGTRLDEATVIAHGSFDVGFKKAKNTDFNEYFNETLSSTQPSPHQQNLQLCPPGYYVNGVGGLAGNFVGQLVFMRCHSPSTDHTVVRTIAGRFGSKRDGMTYTWSACPAGSHVYALFSKTGWFTDGFVAACR